MSGIFAYEFSVVNRDRPRIFRVLVTVLFAFALATSLVGVLKLKATGATNGHTSIKENLPAGKQVVVYSPATVSATPYHLVKNAQ